MDKDMNEELKELYSHLQEFLPLAVAQWNDDKKKHGIKISNPWLIKVPREYINARKKVMLIGQEAYGWYGEYSKKPINELLLKYYEGFLQDQTRKGCYRPSPIWNLYRNIISWGKASNAYVISNNIGKLCYVKKDKDGNWKGTTGFHKKVNMGMIDTFRKEIEICKPDLIIFVCGETYEQRYLKEWLGEYKVKEVDGLGVDSHHLAELVFTSSTIKLPKVYRTHHPRYLQMNKNKTEWSNKIYSFIEKIIRE